MRVQVGKSSSDYGVGDLQPLRSSGFCSAAVQTWAFRALGRPLNKHPASPGQMWRSNNRRLTAPPGPTPSCRRSPVVPGVNVGGDELSQLLATSGGSSREGGGGDLHSWLSLLGGVDLDGFGSLSTRPGQNIGWR